MAFKSKLDYTKLKSVLSVLNLRAPFTYQNLQITDVLLDAESKNLFFTTQHGSANAVSVSISEATAFALDNLTVPTLHIRDMSLLSISTIILCSLVSLRLFLK